MARPTVTYTTSGGSNTLASGAGPATAITGSNAFSGSGVAGGGTQEEIDLSGDSPDLSGVATDGSAVLWLNTPAGDQKMFRITVVNDSTDIVTIHQAPDNPINTGSEVTWAIGGKRSHAWADYDNGSDFVNDDAGWIYEFEGGTYSYTMPAGHGDVTGGDTIEGPTIIRGKAGETVTFQPGGSTWRYTLDVTAGTRLLLQNINFDSNTTDANPSIYVFMSGNSLVAKDCYFTHKNSSGYGTVMSGNATSVIALFNCEFDQCSNPAGAADVGAVYFYSRVHFAAVNCSFHDNDTGIDIDQGTSYPSCVIVNSVFYDNKSDGLWLDTGITGGHALVVNCTFDKNDGSGINFANNSGGQSAWIANCASTNNGVSGIEIGGAPEGDCAYIFNCLASGNTTAQIDSNGNTNLQEGNDTTSSPGYTNTGEGVENYTPASGSALIDAGLPAKTS